MMATSRELTPEQRVVELHDEFMLESANYKLEQDPLKRDRFLDHINALLDAYLDMWPELMKAE